MQLLSIMLLCCQGKDWLIFREKQRQGDGFLLLEIGMYVEETNCIVDITFVDEETETLSAIEGLCRNKNIFSF